MARSNFHQLWDAAPYRKETETNTLIAKMAITGSIGSGATTPEVSIDLID